MKQQEAFYTWLSNYVPQSRLSDYFMLISDIEAYAKKKKLISGSIFDVSAPDIIDYISTTVSKDRVFHILHKKQMKSIAECFDHLKRFMKENGNRPKDVPITLANKSATITPKSQAKPIINSAIQNESSDLEMSGSDSDSSASSTISKGEE